ncbi:MAG: hypothetical protein PHT76_16205 [Anaerostipes sp.]|nr:hypothetical protein [Anaerostipes sp.]
MKKDITYREIECIRENIDDFINNLYKNFQSEIDITKADESFYRRIAKYIIFCKMLKSSFDFKEIHIFLDNVISDSYYMILSIIKREKRYMYVNLRSIIENNIRMITHVTWESTHVTKDVFEKIKNEKYNLSREGYDLLRSEYREACAFIHGGKLLSPNLSYVLADCLEKDEMVPKERNKLYKRVERILKLFNSMLITEYTRIVNNVFYRRKSVLKYLIGSEMLELLFKHLK